MFALFQIALRLLTDLMALTALALRQRRATAAEIWGEERIANELLVKLDI